MKSMQWLTTAGLIAAPAVLAVNEISANSLPKTPEGGLVYLVIALMAGAVGAMWRHTCKAEKDNRDVIVALTRTLTELKTHCENRGKQE